MPKKTVYKPSKQPKQAFLGGGLKPPEFMPSYLEWLSTRGKQIIQNREKDTSGSVTIYEVPKNQTLFITNSFLNVWVNTATAPGMGKVMNFLKIDNVSMLHYYVVNPIGNFLESKNYPIPLIIHEKQKIILGNSSTDSWSTAGFIGFLIANNDLPII